MKHRLLAATLTVGALGLGAAGASAFTDGNSVPVSAQTLGYSHTTVTGATLAGVTYLSDGSGNLASVSFVADGVDDATVLASVSIYDATGNGSGGPVTSPYITCGDGVYASSNTTWTCTLPLAGDSSDSSGSIGLTNYDAWTATSTTPETEWSTLWTSTNSNVLPIVDIQGVNILVGAAS